MQQRYRYFRRNTGIFYLQDRVTGHQESLRTKDETQAKRLTHAHSEAHEKPDACREIGRVYIKASDPEAAKRTWQQVLEEAAKNKAASSTSERWQRAIKDEAFNIIRSLTLAETRAEHFLKVLEQGTVATNVFLRRVHNFALDMDWIARPILPKRQWPTPRYQDKRAITESEHRQIVEREQNPERRAFYQLLWHLGGSQSDVALLLAENFNRKERYVSFVRLKSKQTSQLHYGKEVQLILDVLSSTGPLFPYLRTVRECDRATEFKKRCAGLGITGVTLHSYRYAWAERARECGYPERFAQEALGHGSKAVHRAYSKNASVKVPSLDEWKPGKSDNVIAVKFPNIGEDRLDIGEPTAERRAG